MSKKKILIIDDEKAIVDVFTMSLIDKYEVVFSLSGTDGIAMARSEKPDLILLDIKMSGMNGWDVCRKLKKDKDTKNIPVMFITGAGLGDEDETMGLEMGAVDYIRKPFSVIVLRARVKKALEFVKDFSKPINVIRVGRISFHSMPLMIQIGKRKILLSVEEYYFLRILMENPGKVIHYKQFYNSIWDCNEEEACKKALVCLVGRLRNKLGEEHKSLIRTEKNKGFILEAE